MPALENTPSFRIVLLYLPRSVLLHLITWSLSRLTPPSNISGDHSNGIPAYHGTYPYQTLHRLLLSASLNLRPYQYCTLVSWHLGCPHRHSWQCSGGLQLRKCFNTQYWRTLCGWQNRKSFLWGTRRAYEPGSAMLADPVSLEHGSGSH